MTLKAEGLDRVEGSNTTWVRLLREKAIEIALRDGEVFIDDVRRWASEQGYSAEMFCEKCTKGVCERVHKNAWGAVFRGADWQWTGTYRKSVFDTNHAHESKVWQYNSAATPQLRKGYVDLNENRKTDWVTPPICRELLLQLGSLTLDTCTKPENHMQARQFYTPQVDGLAQSWLPNEGGISWSNHPWSREETPLWVAKACAEGSRLHREGHKDNEIVLLGPARPDTDWFRKLWGSADVMYFWKGRITFIDPDTGKPAVDKKGNASPVPVPVQLSYWGMRPQRFIDVFMQQGGCYHAAEAPF